MPLLTVGLLFIFMHLSCVHLTTDCKFMLKNTAHAGKNSIFERTSGPTSTSPKTTTASSSTRHKQQEIQFLHKS